MPPHLQRRVSAVDETVKFDFSPATSPENNAALVALSASAQQRQRVHLHYRSAQGDASERDFDPYGLAYRGGRWYVAGICHLHNNLRAFRLDRIGQVRQLEQAFTRPADFDALTHLAFAVASIPRAFTIQVLLKTDLKAARAELFDAIGILEQTEEGVLLHNQSDDLDWFARQLAGLPFAFEIHHPAALRDAVTSCAQRLLLLAKK